MPRFAAEVLGGRAHSTNARHLNPPFLSYCSFFFSLSFFLLFLVRSGTRGKEGRFDAIVFLPGELSVFSEQDVYGRTWNARPETVQPLSRFIRGLRRTSREKGDVWSLEREPSLGVPFSFVAAWKKGENKTAEPPSRAPLPPSLPAGGRPLRARFGTRSAPSRRVSSFPGRCFFCARSCPGVPPDSSIRKIRHPPTPLLLLLPPAVAGADDERSWLSSCSSFFSLLLGGRGGRGKEEYGISSLLGKGQVWWIGERRTLLFMVLGICRLL